MLRKDENGLGGHEKMRVMFPDNATFLVLCTGSDEHETLGYSSV